MLEDNKLNRRTVLGGVLAAASAPLLAQTTPKKRIATVGTGHRGSGTWGTELLKELGDRVEFVGLCDTNRKRAETARRHMKIPETPIYNDLERMIRETRPEVLIVTTRDATHHQMIIKGLEMGLQVITEKPMTTDEVKCQAILDAEKKYGKQIVVAFNYRYSNVSQKLKELLMAQTVGPIVSVDFHWYLDTFHGVDYFRRWHAYRENSGTLLLHKASHHFDLINWFLDADPVQVQALGGLRRYGKNGEMRAKNCRNCSNKCEFYWDINKQQRLVELYAQCESEDGYLRDACVFRPDIDIFDTMTGEVRYSNGAIMSYSLNTFMPYEGYHMAFNGKNGRIEVRCYERQPWESPKQDEIRVTKNFQKSEIVTVPWATGGHFGADPRLHRMIFVADTPDPLKQRAGSRAGAMSALTGVAARKSIDSGGKPVQIADLIRL